MSVCACLLPTSSHRYSPGLPGSGRAGRAALSVGSRPMTTSVDHCVVLHLPLHLNSVTHRAVLPVLVSACLRPASTHASQALTGPPRRATTCHDLSRQDAASSGERLSLSAEKVPAKTDKSRRLVQMDTNVLIRSSVSNPDPNRLRQLSRTLALIYCRFASARALH